MAGLMGAIEKSIITNIDSAISSADGIIQDDLLKLNDEFYEGVQWVAVLDKDTCLACAGLDNNIYTSIFSNKSNNTNIIQGEIPSLPLHERCRCIHVPVLVGDSESVQSGDLTYENWFERQPEETKIDILGPSRYGLYRKGEGIKSFSNNGKIMTLEELGIKRVTRKSIMGENKPTNTDKPKPKTVKKPEIIPVEKMTEKQYLDSVKSGKPLNETEIKEFREQLKQEFEPIYRRALIAADSKDMDRKTTRYINTIVKDFQKLPGSLQRLIREANVHFVQGKSDDCYFNSRTFEVFLGKEILLERADSHVAFIHELGHAAFESMHTRLNAFAGITGDPGLSVSPFMKGFLDSMRGEFTEWISTAEHKYQADSFKSHVNILSGVNNSAVSDMARALSGGKYGGNYGHSPGYYAGKIKDYRLTTELFAHLTAGYTNQKGMDRIFPETIKSFRAFFGN
jgi:hypothetical protein